LNKNKQVLKHGTRVAKFSCAIAKELKYCDDGIKQICLAAFTHDIGKIQLPMEIVNKPGALDGNELAIIRKHPELGYRLLLDVKLDNIASDVALQHPERLDGSGYPFGLRAKDINPVTRIIAVGDVIDTMVSPQVYRPALSMNEALQEIKKNSGLLYDPEVVASSLIVIGEQGFHFDL
jgi:HD-GYP domain-containing protein (c-di-GMP phosphodiesterase class II)